MKKMSYFKWSLNYPSFFPPQSQQQEVKVQKEKTPEREPGPPPKPVGVIEEDRIILKPIGPGMQTLEPENTHASTSTLNRATTPSFPISPG